MIQPSPNRSRKPRRSKIQDVPGAATRALAAQVVAQVLGEGRSLTAALAHASAVQPPPVTKDPSPAMAARLSARDLPLLQELCYGVLRTLPRLDAFIAHLLARPLKERDQDIHCLLRVGLYQLDRLATPDHAAVAATVAATPLLDKAWAGGLVNAVLRRFARERAALADRIQADTAAATLFPPWLQARLEQAWPAQWRELIAASNARAPIFLRVNRLRTDPCAYRALLLEAGIEAEFVEGAEDALSLPSPLPSSRLPGFAAGLVSIQDLGAQRAARLLNPLPGQRVLDACAAPGGKASHLQELTGNQLTLTALDRDAERVENLRTNLSRLGIEASIHQADAQNADEAWADGGYDRILLDAPCSGTGVIRRHPDIKWLRRDQDIAPLADTQARLLDRLWPLLREGGELLYVTCSLLPEENERQIGAFLEREPRACERPIVGDWGLTRAHGRQLLPDPQGSDGFFFARLGCA